VLIDEINRGDIPRIFGELLTLLEKDKRGRELALPLSGEKFSVPENVFLVGTMNTADRSIALLDSALRRRFAFVELPPDPAVLGNAAVAQLPLGPWLRELNGRIVKHVGRDARGLQVGHAYLMHGSTPITDPTRFLEVFRDDLLPLLEEYCYDDFETLASIVGAPLVSRDGRGAVPRITAFEDGQELIKALLQSFDGLATAPETIAAEEDSETKVDEPEDDADDVSGS
jgi:5-methylcytosine-specific restriction protein B